MNRYLILPGVLVVIVLAGGCGPEKPAVSENAETASPQPAAEASEAPADPLRELFTEARRLLSEGQTNAVLELLEDSQEKPEFEESRPEIYKAVTIVMLMSDRINEVKTRLARDFKDAPDLAGRCLGSVRLHYLRQDDRDGAHAWVEQLLALDIEDERIEATLRGWQIGEYLHREDYNRVIELARAALTELSPETAANVVRPAISETIHADRLEAAEALIVLLEAVPDGGALLAGQATAYRAELDVQRGDIKKGMDKLDLLLGGDNDWASRHVYNVILNRAREDDDRAAIDDLCMLILNKQGAPDSLRRTVVTQYLALAADTHIGEYPTRVTKLLEAGVQPPMLRGSLSRDFLKVLNEGGAAVWPGMLGIALRLAELEDDADAKDRYLASALDAHVAAGDYGKALAMVDAGFRKDNQEWRAVVVPKLRAHLAIEEGRKQEAIQYFREFMRAAAASEQQPDKFALEKTLGMNAARIGDLWRETGETGKAREAYLEARTHYTEALKAPRVSDEQKKDIDDQLAQIAGQLERMP